MIMQINKFETKSENIPQNGFYYYTICLNTKS